MESGALYASMVLDRLKLMWPVSNWDSLQLLDLVLPVKLGKRLGSVRQCSREAPPISCWGGF